MKLLQDSASRVWLLLMLATVVTTWGLSKDLVDARAGTVAIFVIAAVKVHLVLLHFMDLRHAPRPLRWVFEAWVLVVSGIVLGLYLFVPGV